MSGSSPVLTGCNIKRPPSLQVFDLHKLIVERVKLHHDPTGPILVTVDNTSNNKAEIERDIAAAKLSDTESSNIILLRIIPTVDPDKNIVEMRADNIRLDLAILVDQTYETIHNCDHNDKQFGMLVDYLNKSAHHEEIQSHLSRRQSQYSLHENESVHEAGGGQYDQRVSGGQRRRQLSHDSGRSSESEQRFAHHDILRQLSQSQGFAKRRDPDRSDRPEAGEEKLEKISNELQSAEKECDKLERQLEKAKRRMPPDEMVKSMVNSGDYKIKLDNIEKLDEDLADAIENLLQEHKSELGHSKSKMWKDKIVTVENATNDYIRRVRKRAEELIPTMEQKDPHPVNSAAPGKAEEKIMSSGGQHSRRGNQASGGNSGCEQQSTSPEQSPRRKYENDSEDEFEAFENQMKNKMKVLEAREKKHNQDVLLLNEENKIELNKIENEGKVDQKALDDKNVEKYKYFKKMEDKYKKMMKELTEEEGVWEEEKSIAMQQMLKKNQNKAENQNKNYDSKKLELKKELHETMKEKETLFKKMKKAGILATPTASELADGPMKPHVALWVQSGHLVEKKELVLRK